MRWGSAEPLPPQFYRKYERIQIAEWFPGWTLEYIDSLSYADRQSIIAYKNAQVMNKQMNRAR